MIIPEQGDYTEIVESNLKHEKHYSDIKEILNSALDKLPEIQKSVLLLRDYEGYDYAEIGENSYALTLGGINITRKADNL